ncbi:hypothetical protein FQA39_LY06369 [Lamprigera yunnana]|nr:hypothetical protein FQA39_LY06369 [Lamprigera yunnana]
MKSIVFCFVLCVAMSAAPSPLEERIFGTTIVDALTNIQEVLDCALNGWTSTSSNQLSQITDNIINLIIKLGSLFNCTAVNSTNILTIVGDTITCITDTSTTAVNDTAQILILQMQSLVSGISLTFTCTITQTLNTLSNAFNNILNDIFGIFG